MGSGRELFKILIRRTLSTTENSSVKISVSLKQES
jgi:hypothetical protein